MAVLPVSKPKHNKHTMKKNLLFIGLDVHAKTITIAVAPGEGGDGGTRDRNKGRGPEQGKGRGPEQGRPEQGAD